MFNYGEVEEEQEKTYQYSKEITSDKSYSALLIELKNGSIASFPYSYYAPTILKNREQGYYTINLIGGGVGLTLHFKNFDEEKQDFLEKMRDSLVNTLYEYNDEKISENQPILDKVEIHDMKKRRA